MIGLRDDVVSEIADPLGAAKNLGFGHCVRVPDAPLQSDVVYPEHTVMSIFARAAGGSRNGRHGVREHVLNFSGIMRLGPRSIGETQETTMQPDEQVGECANLLRRPQALILRVR